MKATRIILSLLTVLTFAACGSNQEVIKNDQSSLPPEAIEKLDSMNKMKQQAEAQQMQVTTETLQAQTGEAATSETATAK